MPSPFLQNRSWWGAPKKFDPNFEDRRISWLELFYDLVYVIAIARITHHLAAHVTWSGFLEYTGLLILVYWGWLNGSLYHDLHGTRGLRTRLMTLWQMMIVAALSITIDEASAERYAHMTIVFMVMQLFITYLWWSVGFYDKDHRRYNLPYTISYLLALGLMGLSLFVPSTWLQYLLPGVILFNYLPPFISAKLLRRSSLDLSLSHSMAERLGLFTIIIFGEVVLGVINGVSKADINLPVTWLHFGLALSIVFVLWWIFFTLVSNRHVKKGFSTASIFEMLFIPVFLALGLIASGLTYIFDSHHHDPALNRVFGYSLAGFLTCISLMLGLMNYPEQVNPIKRQVRISLFITALVFTGWSLSGLNFGLTWNLVTLLGILIAEIIYINSLYYSLDIDESALV